MSENKPFISDRKNFRLAIFLLLGLLVLARIGYGKMMNGYNGALLQGNVYVEPSTPLSDDQTGKKIQPGTSIKLKVIVENKGKSENPPGEIFIRYAFAKPMQEEERSIIFETEKKPLPSIEPGKEIEITFDTPHQTPSVIDFIRHDWTLREYQAVAEINEENKVIGTLAITFSAYYYPGVRKQYSKQFP